METINPAIEAVIRAAVEQAMAAARTAAPAHAHPLPRAEPLQARAPPGRLLRLPAVLDRVAMGKSEIFDAVSRRIFPRPVRILEGGRAVAWLESEIDDYIAARLAARDAELAQRQQPAAEQPATAASPPPKRRGRPRKPRPQQDADQAPRAAAPRREPR